MKVYVNLNGLIGLNALKFNKMKNYILLHCDMLNDDGRKYGTAYFYAEDPMGNLKESEIDEIRNIQSDDIWRQTWMVKCDDRNDALTKKREYMEVTGQI